MGGPGDEALGRNRNPQSEDTVGVQADHFVAAPAFQGLRDFSVPGDGLPDIEVVASQNLVFGNQDFRVASDLLGSVLIKGGEIAAVAGELSEGETEFDSAEAIFGHYASRLISEPIAVENHSH
jgi:hypothetical protein